MLFEANCPSSVEAKYEQEISILCNCPIVAIL